MAAQPRLHPAAIDNTSFVWFASCLFTFRVILQRSFKRASRPMANGHLYVLAGQASGSPRHQKGKYCSAYVLPR